MLYFNSRTGHSANPLPGHTLPFLLTVPGGRMRTQFASFVDMSRLCFSYIRRFSLTVLILPALLGTGCARFPAAKQPENRPSFATLETTVVAKGVDRMETTSDPRDVSDFIKVEDEQVVFWVKLGELSGIHHLRWEWYAPSGELYVSSGEYAVNRDGKPRPFSTSWHKIAIKGEKAATLTGQWQVQLFLDGNLAATRTFYLRN